jgi:tetratricopeptide (TPR) repeat protein
LALLKKQEEICLALGNQDSLQRSYGNQANILQGWGRFDEALALLNKVEEICLALGSKQGLGYCYWNWGLLERALNHPQPEKEKLAAALAIFEELKMPRERDAVKAELEQTHAAGA